MEFSNQDRLRQGCLSEGTVDFRFLSDSMVALACLQQARARPLNIHSLGVHILAFAGESPQYRTTVGRKNSHHHAQSDLNIPTGTA
jgi:hypothetical protein